MSLLGSWSWLCRKTALLLLSSGSVSEASRYVAEGQSPHCGAFLRPHVQEFVAQLPVYDSLSSQELNVSASLSRALPQFGLRLVPRVESVHKAPTDFVLLQLFTCAWRQLSPKSSCYGAEAAVLEDSKVYGLKRLYANRKYDRAQLLQFTPSPTETKVYNATQRHLDGNAAPTNLAEALGLSSLWERGFRGKGVKIAVFDTGVTTGRSTARRNVRERINWTHEKKNEDLVGHGTFVSGVLTGSDAKCPGLAPEAELLVFRMFTQDQLSFTSWFLDAFNYALFRRVNVLNLSTGGPDFRDRPFVDKIQELTANGITIVSAVGNSGPYYGSLTNPADQIEVIGVGGVTRDGNDVVSFSSRGMTTWELPFGAGRVKPDLVTLAEDIAGEDRAEGCTSLSGTSMSAPIVSGAIALLASIVPSEHRWNLLNPASIKQILLQSADRLVAYEQPSEFLVRNHIFEQGAGRLNITRASELVQELWLQFEIGLQSSKPLVLPPSTFPDHIDTSECPYLWPLCSQPLFHSSLPLMVNLTIINPASISGTIDSPPQWLPEDDLGEHLTVSVASPDMVWPYFGSVGVFVEVNEPAANATGAASGTLSMSLRSGDGQLTVVRIPIRVDVVPTPNRKQRVLWDQFHNIAYPSAFIPRDHVGGYAAGELLDAAGDHPHTNFHQLWNFLRHEGFYVDILPFEYSCLPLGRYGVLLLADPEEEFFRDEIIALEHALKYEDVSLLLFADWYDEQLVQSLDLFDTSTLTQWHAATGGANVPAINALLREFRVALATDGVVSSSEVSLLVDDDGTNGTQFPYLSGSFLTRFPVGGYVASIDGFDQSALTMNQSELPLRDVPVLGLYQVPSRSGGRIAVFGDSSCIDASVHRSDAGFQHCFSMVRSLLRFTIDGMLPTDAEEQLGGWRRLDMEFNRHTLSSITDEMRLRLLQKHSKVLRASTATPTRQSFCHFHRQQQCQAESRVTMHVASGGH